MIKEDSINYESQQGQLIGTGRPKPPLSVVNASASGSTVRPAVTLAQRKAQLKEGTVETPSPSVNRVVTQKKDELKKGLDSDSGAGGGVTIATGGSNTVIFLILGVLAIIFLGKKR